MDQASIARILAHLGDWDGARYAASQVAFIAENMEDEIYDFNYDFMCTYMNDFSDDMHRNTAFTLLNFTKEMVIMANDLARDVCMMCGI